MSKVATISREFYAEALSRQQELASSVIVLACGAALIFAGQVLPL